MKKPKVKHTIAGEHTKYTARCMEGEYHSQQVPIIKNEQVLQTLPVQPADFFNDGLNAIPMRNWLYEKDRFPCQSGLQRFVNKYGYNWKDDTK